MFCFVMMAMCVCVCATWCGVRPGGCVHVPFSFVFQQKHIAELYGVLEKINTLETRTGRTLRRVCCLQQQKPSAEFQRGFAASMQ